MNVDPLPKDEPQVAISEPSGNQNGHSPVSVGPWTSRWPVPSGLTTYTCVSPRSGLPRVKVIWPLTCLDGGESCEKYPNAHLILLPSAGCPVVDFHFEFASAR
jgi:hypothetical protein